MIGFSRPWLLVRCIAHHSVRHFSPVLNGGCAQGALGRAGFANFPGRLTCAQLPPFV
ncbi:hypothetical protein EMIT0194MI4_20646 [Pseudomonas sp. IT-194MI4]